MALWLDDGFESQMNILRNFGSKLMLLELQNKFPNGFRLYLCKIYKCNLIDKMNVILFN